MTPPESEYQRFYIPKAIQRILDKNPDNIIPITKEAKENRLWRIAEGPARETARSAKEAARKQAELEALRARKAAELAEREAAEQERRRPLAPLERMVRERLSDIWVKYGLSKERLATMLEKQEWKCAICGEEFKLLKFSVDHSHLPPFKVRGLLCHRCNLRIGGWDDPKFAQSAAFYLKVPGVNSAKRGTAMDGRKKSATITPIKSREINQVDDLSTEEQEGDASVGSPGKTEESAGLSDFEEPKTAPEPLPQIPNLDQPTGTSFQPPPDPGLSALEELLKASETDFSLDKDQSAIGIALDPARAIFGVPSNPLGKDTEMVPPEGLISIPTAEEVAAIENGDRLPTMAEHEAALERGDVAVITSQEGPQPNGDYGIVVTVPEQLVSGVLGQAELDGVSPSEWLSVRLGEYLSQWFFGK